MKKTGGPQLKAPGAGKCPSASLILRRYQRHALEAFRASVGDEEGHEADCILAREGEQANKI